MQQHLTTDLRQTQRLTPLQVQFVRMLEMTGPEAEDEVQRALDEMPALEAVDPHEEPDAPVSDTRTEDGADFTETGEQLARADYSSDDDIPEYLRATSWQSEAGDYAVSSGIRRCHYDSPLPFPEQHVEAEGEGLTDRLMAQVAELDLAGDERRAAEYIVGSIDPNGYMTRSIGAIADDLAINEGIDIAPDRMKQIWEMVRGFDPAGIAATDLRDCFLLQLRRLPRSVESRTAIEIIRDHFDLFTNKHFRRIASRLEVSPEDVQSAVRVISHLDPKPGGGLPDDRLARSMRGISPDFLVEAHYDGTLSVTSLSRIPALRVEASFAEESDAALRGSSQRLEEARAFLKAKRDDARNFIRVVDMRATTLFNVVSAIVRLQRPFFLSEDEEDIRPMVLKDVAAVTGYDLSTISRATQGKYIATLRGIYPLKKFFNERIREADDSVVTANRVMALIRSAVEAEDKRHPVSDRIITERLAAEGLDIARRTVAKYRESMGIPVARLRRQT